MHLFSKDYTYDEIQYVFLADSYRMALFRGLQILQILWILGISMKFISPKISENSIVSHIAD